MATETCEFKPHSMQTIESTELTPQEPLLPQLVTPATPPTTLQDQTQLAIYQTRERPPEYNDWTSSKKANWRKKVRKKPLNH